MGGGFGITRTAKVYSLPHAGSYSMGIRPEVTRTSCLHKTPTKIVNMPCTKPNLLSASRESQRTTHHKVGRAEKGKFQGSIFDSWKPKWQNFLMPVAASLSSHLKKVKVTVAVPGIFLLLLTFFFYLLHE